MRTLLAMFAEFLVGEFFAKRIGWTLAFIGLMLGAETLRAKVHTSMPFGIAAFLVIAAAHGIGFL